jgi:hypothetical protein
MGRERVEPTDRHRRVAASYLSGHKSLEQAMADEGFAAGYGRRGIQNVARASAPFAAAFNEEIKNITAIASGMEITPEQARKLVNWRLAVNIARGKDEGVHSAKLMGTRKDVDMFVRFATEGAQGIFVTLATQEAKEILEKIAEDLPKSDSAASSDSEAAAPSISGEPQS